LELKSSQVHPHLSALFLSSSANTALISVTKYNVKTRTILSGSFPRRVRRFKLRKAEMRKRTDRAKQVLLRKMSTVKQEKTDAY
jgi:hypothetical protein